jgi:hypothetical protein
MSDDDDNPLGNVKQQLEQSETKQGQEDEVSQEKQDSKVDKEPIPEKDAEKEEEYGPPFPFSATHQRPLYPHEDSWEEWEDAKFEAEAKLRKNGVRDPHGREFDDALLQMGIENPELLAEYILEARGLDLED